MYQGHVTLGASVGSNRLQRQSADPTHGEIDEATWEMKCGAGLEMRTSTRRGGGDDWARHSNK